jgi:hypothetical protein
MRIVRTTKFAAVLLALPVWVTAAGYTDLLRTIQGFVNDLIPLTIGLALVFFLWSLALFMLKTDSKDAKEKGKRLILWGIITLVVMTAIWGIVNGVIKTFDLEHNPPPVPVYDPSRFSI